MHTEQELLLMLFLPLQVTALRPLIHFRIVEIFAEACKMNEIGTQSRAQCDQILKGMDSKIENIKATGGAYGEIVGHLKVIAGRA